MRTPALRENRADIPALVKRFIEDLRHVNVVKGISPEALQALTQYHWPGNARQLRNVIEYALHFAETEGLIERHHLPDAVGVSPDEEPAKKKDKTSRHVTAFDQARLETAARVLEECNDDVKKAAVILKRSPRTVWRLRKILRHRLPD